MTKSTADYISTIIDLNKYSIATIREICIMYKVLKMVDEDTKIIIIKSYLEVSS